jgi:hypothetical protein
MADGFNRFPFPFQIALDLLQEIGNVSASLVNFAILTSAIPSGQSLR